MDNRPGDEKSQVLLSIELDPSLHRLLDSRDSFHEALTGMLVQSLEEVMETLGIPGTPHAEISAIKETALKTDRFLRISVNGYLCRYPDELLQRAYSYVTANLLDPVATPGNILAWLHVLSHDFDLNCQQIVEFLSLTCLEVIKRQPQVLLGVDQVLEYLASLTNSGPETVLSTNSWPPTRLLPILRSVLALKISLADKQRVAEILASAQGQEQADISEVLIAALCPGSIEIHLPLDYLKQITTTDVTWGLNLFTLLRKDIFPDNGLIYPPFRFVCTEHLKPHSFAFKVNHLLMLPWIGLLPKQYFVMATTSTLESLNMKSNAIAHPMTGNEVRLIDLDMTDPAAVSNLDKYNLLFYLVLCFDLNLRENAACFVDRKLVQTQIKQLQSTYPALIKIIKSEVAETQIIQVLRALVGEEISIRNLRLILESLLDYKYSITALVSHNSSEGGVEEQPGTHGQTDFFNLLTFIRYDLRRQILHKYAGEANVLQAYQLHSEVEQLLLKRQSRRSEGDGYPTSAQDDEIIQAVRMTLGSSLSLIPIITTSKIRPLLREMIATEFPRVPVLASDELGDANIKQVAQISLQQDHGA